MYTLRLCIHGNDSSAGQTALLTVHFPSPAQPAAMCVLAISHTGKALPKDILRGTCATCGAGLKATMLQPARCRLQYSACTELVASSSAVYAMQVIIEEPKVEVDLLEPILEENRMCVEYRHVSAYVPAKVTPGGFFSGLQLPAFTAKAKAKEKDKLRRVSLQPPEDTDSAHCL